MKTNHLHLSIENSIATLVFDMHDSNANTLSKAVLEELDSKLDEIKSNQTIQALLLKSAKKDIFIAGANIKEIEPMNDEKTIYDYLMRVNDIFLKLERLKFPTIAFIDGSCMGGGLELSLACTYRIASDEKRTKLAFPEVKLGFFPGFGGTQRLPKMIGLIPSLDLILTGKTIDAKKAYRLGLIDDFFAAGQSSDKVEAFIQKAIKKRIKTKVPLQPMQYLKITREYVFKKALENLKKKVHPKYFGPYMALDVIHQTFKTRHHIGIKVEAKAFSEIAVTKESKHLIQLFFTSQALKKEYANKTDIVPIEQTAVIGSGVMGQGIIWLFSQYAKGVRIKLRQLDQTQKILHEVKKLYDYFIKTGKLSKKQVDFKLNKLSYTQDFKGFKLIDFALEAIIEDEEKIKTYEALQTEINKDTILATNTSSISIEKLSKNIKNKANFLGVHFFNPVNKMPLVEVIPNSKTSQQTLKRVFEFLKSCGKTPILVHDCAGFLINRVLLPYINEASYILQEGNTISKVDNTLKEFGMPMGAFELADVVGIDIGYKVAEILEASYGKRMKVCELLTDVYKNKKLLGKKSGKGFYIYLEKEPKVNTDLEDTKHSIQVVTTTDILDRCILIMVNEASRCLEEGVITNASYLDFAMIAGTGFPAFKGGLLKYADELGIDYVVEKLQEFEKTYGERFAPSELLLKLQQNKKTFYTGETLWK